jgi:(+)-neomenthol dehydrogenase
VKQIAGKNEYEVAAWLKQRTTQSTQEAVDSLKINYHGTKNVTEALLPLVQSSSDGRIVNVTSAFGLLRVCIRHSKTAPSLSLWLFLTCIPLQFFSGDELRQEMNRIDSLTKQRLDQLPAQFLEDYRSGDLERRGWPTDPVYAAYQVSKALVCAYTRILARENPALRVNCVHPGYVETEMNCNTGNLTAAEGASVSVVVALAELGGVTGVYFDRTEVASFV